MQIYKKKIYFPLTAVENKKKQEFNGQNINNNNNNNNRPNTEE